MNKLQLINLELDFYNLIFKYAEGNLTNKAKNSINKRLLELIEDYTNELKRKS